MAFLSNPNLAHLLVVVGVMLLLLTKINRKSTMPKVGIALCFVAAGLVNR
jgi:membrane-bound ClpP family serine protease